MLDLDALLAPAHAVFGVRVLYAAREAPAVAVQGVFDREHVEVFGADGVGVSTLRAQLSVRLAAFPADCVPAQGDEVQVAIRRGRAVDHTDPAPAGAELVDYVVQDVQADAEGGALLVLTTAA